MQYLASISNICHYGVMLQFPHQTPFENTKQIIESIQVKATALRHIPISQQHQSLVLHRQVLKSSLFSARIEGNNLTLVQAQQVNLDNPKEKSQREISNVLKVLNNLSVYAQKKVDHELLLTLHSQIMHGLHADAGKFRRESSAIFDGAGNAVYVTPGPEEMQQMLAVLFEQMDLVAPSSDQDDQVKQLQSKLTTIAHCHYYYEKIHPFIDGNGRLGRVLLHLQLQQANLCPGWIIPIDEYFDEHRSEYYFHLEKNSRNQDSFVLFVLQALDDSLSKLLADISQMPEQVDPEVIHLLPRRQELKAIIADHPYCSLDMLVRRFPSIPRRTIAYDVNWLVKNKHVVKYGKTRGVRYGIGSRK